MKQPNPETSATKIKLAEHIQLNEDSGIKGEDSGIKGLVEHIVNMGHVDFSLNDFLLIASDEECMLLIDIVKLVKSQGKSWLDDFYSEYIEFKCPSCKGGHVNQYSDGWECLECGLGIQKSKSNKELKK